MRAGEATGKPARKLWIVNEELSTAYEDLLNFIPNEILKCKRKLLSVQSNASGDWASILFEYFMGVTHSINICVFFYQLEKVPREGLHKYVTEEASAQLILVSLLNHVWSNWANADPNS